MKVRIVPRQHQLGIKIWLRKKALAHRYSKEQNDECIKKTIYANRSLCTHAGYCTDNLATVFRIKQEPWIDTNAGTIEDIIEENRS